MRPAVLVVHRSNRMEQLVEALSAVLARPVDDPLLAETILLQSRGLQRWLSMELAARLGVWANASFPFPRSFFEGLFDRLEIEGPAEPVAFAREQLTWTIAALLATAVREPAFAPVAAYVGETGDAPRRLELARQLAQSFDQYVVYRPDLIASWESGADDHWQAQLWRRIVAHHGTAHFASRARHMMGLPEFDVRARKVLPPRLAVIGISALPPLYVALLGRVAEAVDVHFFWLSPCREYWAFTRAPRELARFERPATGMLEPDHWEVGNALLGAFGRQGREFQHVFESALTPGREQDAYVEPGSACVLHTLQDDVLALRARGAGFDEGPAAFRDDDTSVQVHSCHSTLRQLEVLKDLLLDSFERDPSLEPRDVIVMAPDIERAAPLIDAVFAERPGGGNIPYRVADRPLGADAALVRAFLTVLRVLRGRMKASEVLDLLHHRPIRARFDIPERELARIKDWVMRSGVRWGRDAEHRSEQGVPAVDAHTWSFGMRRLLLGVAMPARIDPPFQGVLPCDGPEGTASDLLGGVSAFLAALTSAQRRVAKPCVMRQWWEHLTAILDALLDVEGSSAWEAAAIRAALGALRDEAERADFDDPLDLRFVERELTRRFGEEQSAHQFMAGGVTFCAMLPMRSIPFRLVCLMDMDDGAFPRVDRPPSFDIVAESPRAGDRSVRAEDRYLFLEALLSARDRFIVLYSGRSVHDHQARPPSVVVSELLDVIDGSFHCAGHSVADRPRTRIVVEHPLTAYSPQYYLAERDPRLFSYSAQNAAAAVRVVGDRHVELPAFQRRELPAPAEQGHVSLGDLTRFLEQPIIYYSERELGLRLRDAEALESDREPLELDGLARYNVGRCLLEWELEGTQPEQPEAYLRAAGLLPHGAIGRRAFEQLLAEAAAAAQLAKRWTAGVEPVSVPLDLSVGGFRLSGVLSGVYGERLVTVAFSRSSARLRLRSWVAHLALQASRGGTATETILVTRAESGGDAGAAVSIFAPVERVRARFYLADLCELYALGRRAPLPFFPTPAEAFVVALGGPGKDDEGGMLDRALAAAVKVYRNERFSRIDGSERAYLQRFLPWGNPLAPALRMLPEGSESLPDFPTLAERVFGPLRRYLQEECP